MILLAPVYQPGDHLLTLVTDLLAAVPGTRVVVVDDGSGPASAPVLEQVGELGCTVLRHEVNRGKGAALKTGFSHIAEAYPGEDVVCADADGQHSVADIRRVAEQTRSTGRITLGVRRFDGDVPLRSRVGNTATRLLFRAATGHGVQDTQTGLRAYPGSLLSWLGSVPGDRFEYEMNALLHATRDGHPMEQVVVSTAYLQDNASSHFSPLSDSARIYLPLIRFAASALTSPTTRR